ADDEAGDVLEEEERHPAGARELDEVGRLERRLREQYALVGQDAERIAVQVGEAGHERLAVERLELVEAAAVDQPGDHLARVGRPARVARYDAVELARVVGRLLRRLRLERAAAGRGPRPEALGAHGERV